MNFLYLIIVNLGVFLLYFPPFLVFTGQRLLTIYRGYLEWRYIFLFSLPLTFIMILLLPQAWGAFLFYQAVFILVMFYAERQTLDKKLAFSLAIYACFAISVLWEWPYQIAFYPSMYVLNSSYLDALIMSSWKALGIPFFFLSVRKIGFKPTDFFIIGLHLTVITGLLILAGLLIFGINHITFWVLHIYRVPWLLILLLAIPRW